MGLLAGPCWKESQSSRYFRWLGDRGNIIFTFYCTSDAVHTVCNVSAGSLLTTSKKGKLIFSSPEPLGSQGELIVYPSSRRPSVGVVRCSQCSKDLLLRNRFANQSQILCGASLGRGNDILFMASGSHDQDGHHAHIW